LSATRMSGGTGRFPATCVPQILPGTPNARVVGLLTSSARFQHAAVRPCPVASRPQPIFHRVAGLSPGAPSRVPKSSGGSSPPMSTPSTGGGWSVGQFAKRQVEASVHPLCSVLPRPTSQERQYSFLSLASQPVSLVPLLALPRPPPYTPLLKAANQASVGSFFFAGPFSSL